MATEEEGSKPALSLFAGTASDPKPAEFWDAGRPLDRWLIAARAFVDLLREWLERDEEDDRRHCPGGPGELWIPTPPDRAIWVSGHCSLSLVPISLEFFREKTGTLVGHIVIDRDIKGIGFARLVALVDLIEDAYLEAEAGRIYTIEPIRRALGRAELDCQAIRTAYDRREASKVRLAISTVESPAVEALAPAELDRPAPVTAPTTAGSRALTAAFELRREDLPVSLKAACKRAGVDRKNVRETYPDVARAITALGAPERGARRGMMDRRTGGLDAVDSTGG